MTLKEELEILRGEPIKVFDGDPMNIPCIETSDPEKLCKNPVVSVLMITYNHEPYIRQAIEGVVMQKTDFEFELIIGEDCSQDKTREICFEYQKKFPDKIRVLWANVNVAKLGGNSRRIRAYSRGEFIALCEGDDYWVDPLKLKKQVDIMRKFPNVGFCFCGAKRYYQNNGTYDNWNDGHISYKPGIQAKAAFFASFMFGFSPGHPGNKYAGFIMTATTMVRRSVYIKISDAFDIFKWQLRVGDATIWLAASTMSDGYYLEDQVAVYRIADTGVFQNPKSKMSILVDGMLIRLYFLKKVWGLCYTDCPPNYIFHINTFVATILSSHLKIKQYARAQRMLPKDARLAQWRWYTIPFWLLALSGFLVGPFWSMAGFLAKCGQHITKKWPDRLLTKYRASGL